MDKSKFRKGRKRDIEKQRNISIPKDLSSEKSTVLPLKTLHTLELFVFDFVALD